MYAADDIPDDPSAAPDRRRLPGEAPILQGPAQSAWGSDAIAQTLRDLDLEYIALNPGSSYRGLHDSLVNYLGNEAPQMLLCLHEEHAVSIAHGYAKVTDRAMAVALHSNVGLMHASMALFNAYCDRVPMLALGATGPLDASRRRPWIDWLHTATDQAALVRPFLKWDDQPLSVEAAVEALLQAHRLTMTAPTAPTYVCLDTSIQECAIGPDVHIGMPPARRFAIGAAPAPDYPAVEDLAKRLVEAKRVVLLIGRTTRSERAWDHRVELAARVGALVFTHLKLPAAFPTSHPLVGAPPQGVASAELQYAIRQADVILALDWLDLGGTLRQAGPARGHIVAVTCDHQLHSGWGKESQMPVPADVYIQASPDAMVDALLRVLPHSKPYAAPGRDDRPRSHPSRGAPSDDSTALVIEDIATSLRASLADGPACLARVPLSWPGDLWDVASPLDWLGGDGGEGVGSGPGMTVGAALALRDSDRLVVSVLGDGDFLMGVNALWTAAHYQLPLLVIVANNRSFFNDEIHQHRVARKRQRSVENQWIGQRISDPEIDLSALARAQGLISYGPLRTRAELLDVFTRAVSEVRAGAGVVIDVHIESSVASDDARAAGKVERG